MGTRLIDRLIGHFGSRQEAAAKLNMTLEGLRLWRRDGIPLSRALDIESATGGFIKAEEVVNEARGAKVA